MDPAFPAEIGLVLSNASAAAGLGRAATAGIASRVIDHRPFGNDRVAFDAALTAALAGAGVELVCLAGFTRLVGAEFVARWWNRLINIHPSLLPAFRGLDTHARALAAGVRLHGCTVHFVRAAMDDGPIIVQGAVPVLGGDTAARLAERVLAVEHRCYPLAVRLIAENRVRVDDERVLIDGAAAPSAALINPPPAG